MDALATNKKFIFVLWCRNTFQRLILSKQRLEMQDEKFTLKGSNILPTMKFQIFDIYGTSCIFKHKVYYQEQNSDYTYSLAKHVTHRCHNICLLQSKTHERQSRRGMEATRRIEDMVRWQVVGISLL